MNDNCPWCDTLADTNNASCKHCEKVFETYINDTNMKFETKFCYKHKPTNKFVYLNCFTTDYKETFYIHLLDEFNEHILFSAKNVLTETAELYSYWSVDHKKDGYEGRLNIDEFELLEVEVTYKIKE